MGKTGREVRGIIRLTGRDVKGEMPIHRALTRVRGIGERLAAIISKIALREMKLPDGVFIGELDEAQMSTLDKIMAAPQKYGVPIYMLNRQKDFETGENKHLTGTDLIYTQKNDVDREKEIMTWRGFRHFYGQKVRGQRTRSTGRTGMTVGVLRKAIMAKAGAPAAGAAPAAAPAKKEEKK